MGLACYLFVFFLIIKRNVIKEMQSTFKYIRTIQEKRLRRRRKKNKKIIKVNH
jgi:hypothetical protein